MIWYSNRQSLEAAGRIGANRRNHMPEGARDIDVRVRSRRH